MTFTSLDDTFRIERLLLDSGFENPSDLSRRFGVRMLNHRTEHLVLGSPFILGAGLVPEEPQLWRNPAEYNRLEEGIRKRLGLLIPIVFRLQGCCVGRRQL